MSDFVILNGVLKEYIGNDEHVVIPKGTKEIGKNAFSNCVHLQSITITKGVMRIGHSAFRGCTNLKSFDTSATRMIGDNMFQNCTNLKVLILRNSSLVPMYTNTTYWAFYLNNTPFDPDYASATGGFVLVPAALLSEYPSATNWSLIYEAGLCTFLPLEEYTVDGTTTGEINWDKLNAVVYAE